MQVYLWADVARTFAVSCQHVPPCHDASSHQLIGSTQRTSTYDYTTSPCRAVLVSSMGPRLRFSMCAAARVGRDIRAPPLPQPVAPFEPLRMQAPPSRARRGRIPRLDGHRSPERHLSHAWQARITSFMHGGAVAACRRSVRVLITWHGEHRVCSIVALVTSPPPATTAFV